MVQQEGFDSSGFSQSTDIHGVRLISEAKFSVGVNQWLFASMSVRGRRPVHRVHGWMLFSLSGSVVECMN